MPPPSNQRASIEPPAQVTREAMKGFATGALRFGSISILAHMILIMPHPFTFSTVTSATAWQEQSARKPWPSPFSLSSIRSRLFYRPLGALSESLAPASRVYRGLTPQFKVFLQIAVMTLGGCVWAEKRVTEYLDVLRRARRAERNINARTSDS
ncbi:hypothetical protein V8E54_008747 [Elaphomyces granulatus]|jgi:hypothetical protein|uniref:Uncharacterized protein n=1 Tax=Elaphomyces granulatus TaxID=519963 RepID=A0A232LZ47_9EURO|nr:hypothetical protein Egran_02796 [Elaphomyces granulatus]